MKKLIWLLFIIIFIASVKADISINPVRTNYSNGETIQFMVVMKDKPYYDLKLSDFSFWDKYNRKVAIGLFLNKFNDTSYYGYFDASGLSEWDYSLKVDNYYYLKNGILLKERNSTIIKIKNSNIVLSIFQGSYILNLNQKNNIDLTLKNPGSMFSVSITSKGSLSETSFYLSGTKTIKITYPLDTTSDDIAVSYPSNSYSIPVKIIPQNIVNTTTNVTVNETINETKTNETLIVNQTKTNVTVSPKNQTVINTTTNVTVNQTKTVEYPVDAVRFIEGPLDLVIDKNRTIEGGLRFVNFFNEPVYNLVFSLTGDLNEIMRFNNTKLEVINPGEELNQYVWINEKKNLNKDYSGQLVFKSGNIYWSLDIKVNLKNETNEGQSDLNNLIPINFSNASIVQPLKSKETSNNWIYFSIIIIILILAGIVYKVYHKGHKPIRNELEEILKDINLK